MFVYLSKIYTDCSTKVALVEVKFDATNEHNAEYIYVMIRIRYHTNIIYSSHSHSRYMYLNIINQESISNIKHSTELSSS